MAAERQQKNCACWIKPGLSSTWITCKESTGELWGTGQEISKEQKDVYTCLKILIRSNSDAIPKQEFKRSFKLGTKNFANADLESAFTMSLWDAVGVKLYDAISH